MMTTALVLAGVLVLGACGEGADRLEGTWIPDVEATLRRMKDTGAPEEAVARARDEMSKAAAEKAFVRFGDGTVTNKDPGQPERSGTWKVVEEKEDAWLVESRMEGAEEPLRLTIEWIDEDHITIVTPQGPGPVLRRE